MPPQSGKIEPSDLGDLLLQTDQMLLTSNSVCASGRWMFSCTICETSPSLNPPFPALLARTLDILKPSGATTLDCEHARRLQHPMLGSMKELRTYKRMK